MENFDNTQATIPYTSNGFLVFNISSANQALPIENASVYIKGADTQNSTVEYNLITDVSGRTERISLAVPSKTLSLSPGTPYGFGRYDATVTKEGYYTQKFSGIPVFDGVTSVQPVLLIAKAPFDSDALDPSNETIDQAPQTFS